MPEVDFIVSRLWRFLSLYFLKPFDAVNDTLTACLLSELDWSGPFVEIGPGDGEFSFVLHGGSFPLWFDRYLMTDLQKRDIFDTHQNSVIKKSAKPLKPRIVHSLDARFSHAKKIREIGFSETCSVGSYERLPLASSSVENVFLYTPHGMQSHSETIKEAHRILRPGGRILLLAYDTSFAPAFVCQNLSQTLKKSQPRRYFKDLDNGRFAEITKMARSPSNWIAFLSDTGFTVTCMKSGLSHFAWKVYDIQTRPVLRPLIRFFNCLPLFLRTAFKFIWIMFWFPLLLVFFCLFSNLFSELSTGNCYLAFEGRKRIST